MSSSGRATHQQSGFRVSPPSADVVIPGSLASRWLRTPRREQAGANSTRGRDRRTVLVANPRAYDQLTVAKAAVTEVGSTMTHLINRVPD